MGEIIDAKFVGVDRKKRAVSLSVKAKESDEEAAAVHEYTTIRSGSGTTLGDIMKAQMDGKDEDNNNT